MNLGLSCYQVGDGPLAERIGATRAHLFADVSDGVPDHTEIIADMAAHGCAPVPDLRTCVMTLGRMIAGQGEPLERRDRALRWFSDSIVEYLDAHPTVADVEVWGSAEVAQFKHGRGEMLNYADVLTDVYRRVKEARPDVRVWTGGFGCAHGTIADLTLLENALAEHAPDAFDVCNMHPFIVSGGYPDVDCNTLRVRLQKARRTLDEKCVGQPLAATGFGLPTLDIPPLPAAYGRFIRLPSGVRAIREEEAMDWYVPLLAVLEECGFETVCLLARDIAPATRFQHYCGLTTATGADKSFTDELATHLHR